MISKTYALRWESSRWNFSEVPFIATLRMVNCPGSICNTHNLKLVLAGIFSSTRYSSLSSYSNMASIQSAIPMDAQYVSQCERLISYPTPQRLWWVHYATHSSCKVLHCSTMQHQSCPSFSSSQYASRYHGLLQSKGNQPVVLRLPATVGFQTPSKQQIRLWKGYYIKSSFCR
jgi:hypothetical protein